MGPIRGPSATSSAGNSVSEPSTAHSTTSTPPMPMASRYEPRNDTRPSRPLATATPEYTTTRPAVAKVRASASGRACPAASSSR
jgi:hypothetical protein